MTAPQHIPKPGRTESDVYATLLTNLAALLLVGRMPGMKVKAQKLREPNTTLITIHAWVPSSEV